MFNVLLRQSHIGDFVQRYHSFTKLLAIEDKKYMEKFLMLQTGGRHSKKVDIM